MCLLTCLHKGMCKRNTNILEIFTPKLKLKLLVYKLQTKNSNFVNYLFFYNIYIQPQHKINTHHFFELAPSLSPTTRFSGNKEKKISVVLARTQGGL